MKNRLHTRSALAGAGIAVIAFVASGATLQDVATSPEVSEEETTMQVHYLEVVTSDVDATCGALEKLHGVSFSEPEANLGNARTAALAAGGRIGVRAPMHDAEESVVRPYLLVNDIESAVQAAEAAGGVVAVPPMEIPEQGKIALYFQGDNQYGLWQL